VWAWMDGRIERGRIGCGASASAPSLCRLSLALLRVGDLPPLPGSCVCVRGPRRSLGHPERVMLRPASFSGLGPAPSYNKKEKPSPLASSFASLGSRVKFPFPHSRPRRPQPSRPSALLPPPPPALSAPLSPYSPPLPARAHPIPRPPAADFASQSRIWSVAAGRRKAKNPSARGCDGAVDGNTRRRRGGHRRRPCREGAPSSRQLHR